ncbi:hypothetical protein Patl1_27391 [Pistacia atlantica]|uniref:Uncharacterized protein n=1 Tax=Pistacia atlantica TaxID=434234 RepID=A0ACC1BEF2_9ROSI|nr:hypothetical protein Patl1_27391 [Pistacia atlantica]
MRLVNKEEEEGEMIVQKVGNDALEINGQTFTFDSVADIDSTQLDLTVQWLPMGREWKDLYAMWGLANALLEENLSSDQQGLTPRIFERLFSCINEKQIKHAEKQLNLMLEALSKKLKAKTVRTEAPSQSIAATRKWYCCHSQIDDEKLAWQKAIDEWLPITSSRNAKWWYSAFHSITVLVYFLRPAPRKRR